MIEPNGTTPGRKATGKTAAETEHPGQPWGEGSEVVGRDGPEEIEAATQRRLLGAFCCSGCAGRRRAPHERRTRAVRCRTWTPCSTVSTPTQRDAVTSTRRAAGDPAPARARARRACSPAASRGSRASGAIDPAHVLAVTFTRKAAGELAVAPRPPRRPRVGHRGHLPRHRPRPAPPPRRRAGPRHARASSTARSGSSCRCCPYRGREARAARRRARVRDRVGQGPRSVKPDGYERAVAAAGRATPRPPAEVAGDLPQLRAGEAQARPGRLRRPHHRLRRRARARHRVRRRATLAVPAPVRRRVPGRQRRAAPAAPRLARRPQPTSASSATPTRRSTASPAPTRRTSPASAAWFPPERFPEVGHGPPRQQLPVDAPGRHRGERGARPARPPSTARSTRRARTAPSPTSREYDSAEDEARGIARALRDAESPQLRWSRMAVLYRVNAQSALFEEALRRAGVPFRVRGGGRFLDRQEVKVALDDLRKTARAAPGASLRRAPHRPRHRRRGAGRGTPRARRRAACASATSTSRPTAAAAASTASSSSCRPSLRGDDAGEASGRRGRAAHVPPGQGARVRHRVRHRPRDAASSRSRTPSPPRRSTRSNGCSTSRSVAPSGCCT